jgi:hypothetical protein
MLGGAIEKLPLGEGRGEGRTTNDVALTLTLSQREREPSEGSFTEKRVDGFTFLRLRAASDQGPIPATTSQ